MFLETNRAWSRNYYSQHRVEVLGRRLRLRLQRQETLKRRQSESQLALPFPDGVQPCKVVSGLHRWIMN
jgi:hypothetical protein